MDLTEAAQRILRVRGVLVLAFALAGLAAGVAVHMLEVRTYTATARLVVDQTVPQDATEAQALAGTVEGIVTSPDRVTAALRAAGISRDLVQFTREITAESLGDSGILALSVTDPDARAAAVVANRLAENAVSTLNQQSQGGDQFATQLQSQIDSLAAERARIDQQIANTSNPTLLAALTSQRNDVTQQLASVTSMLVNLEQQRTQASQAAIIDSASTPTVKDPSRLPLDAIIGLLAGLIAGIGLAALAETLRPTAVGPRAIERALGAPVLGTLSTATPDKAEELLAIKARIRQAGADEDVSTALVWSPVEDLDLRAAAQALQAAQPSAGPRLPDAVAFRVFDRADGDKHAGLIAVVPPAVRLAALTRAGVISTAHGWPLLGVVICSFRRWPSSLPSRVASMPTEAVAS